MLEESALHIGHVCLTKDFDETAQQLLLLVDALTEFNVRQHVIVRCPSLAGRLSAYREITLGPLAESPVSAYSALPTIDIAHVHDLKSARTGLLLTLTRSTPYIISFRGEESPPGQALARSIHRRAASIVCNSAAAKDAMRSYCPGAAIELVHDADNMRDPAYRHSQHPDETAAAYLRIYRRILGKIGSATELIQADS